MLHIGKSNSRKENPVKVLVENQLLLNVNKHFNLLFVGLLFA